MKFRRALGLVAIVAPALVGCGGPLGTGDEGSGPHVVASFYPLAYVAERVAGEHAQVSNLTSPGAEPHDLELSVMQTAEVSEADLVIYEKGLQPAVDEAVAQNDPAHVVEATEDVPLDEPDPDVHRDESAEEHAAHGEADPNLHFWLDPNLMVQLAWEVKSQMSEVDPEHDADYEASFHALRADLKELERAYAQGLSRCRIDTVVVSHDAFTYLEKYGLHFEAIAGLTPDAEPSPAHVAELEDLIRSEGVTTVFSETLASPEMAETLADDLGLRTDVLDPVEGLTDSTTGEDYLSLMRSNLDALREASQCR